MRRSPNAARIGMGRRTDEVFGLIEWRRFEAVVDALFAQAGFETRTQLCGADGGVDIWLHSQTQAGAAVSLVQCKQWTSWKVGVKPVRELRGVMAAHGIVRGQFVTTSGYTADAKTFAQENGIMLHDTPSLLALIASRSRSAARRPRSRPGAVAVIFSGRSVGCTK